MSTPAGNSGSISKMKFIAYADEEFQNSLNKEFVVQYNPKTLGADYSITYEESQGRSNTVKFVKAKPTDITVEFTLDGTGIDIKPGETVPDVQTRIEAFLEMCKEMNDREHEPPFIMITYGKLIYKTRFKACNITYTLFKSDGAPLRAVLKATFLNIKNNITDERERSLNSPDVTHRREILEHQSLIQIANMMYKRNDLYIEVAKANQLDSFRKAALKHNDIIYFPPIKK